MNYLLIGCTGSLGQAILHTLLVNTKHTLFVAIREKTHKGSSPHKMTIQERIHSIFQSIHLDYSTYSKRIVLIPCSYDKNRNILLSEKDKTMLKDSIHVFLNALADIQFTRELTKATKNNATTALNWMAIYNECPHATQYTYVSTAFTGFHRAPQEKIIPEELHIEHSCGHTLDTCETTYSKILNGHIGDNELRQSVFENSYTYTKNLTELLLTRRIKKGSLYIVRPSIIVSAVNQPYKGWGQFQTFHVFILGMITGRCLFYQMDYEKHVLNTVPVDMVANDCIRLLPDTEKTTKTEKEPTILHSCLTHNSPKWNQHDEFIYTALPEYIYLTYSSDPLRYNNQLFYPSRVQVFRTRLTYLVSILFLLVKQLLVNILHYGLFRGVQDTWKQLMFTWKYNQLFTPFSTKNCCFRRTAFELSPCYASVSHKDSLMEFIDHVPELLAHSTISWLS